MLNQFLSHLTQQCIVSPLTDAVSLFRVLSFVQIVPCVALKKKKCTKSPTTLLLYISCLFLIDCQHCVVKTK